MIDGLSGLFILLLASCLQDFYTCKFDSSRTMYSDVDASAMLPCTVPFAHQMRRAIFIRSIAGQHMSSPAEPAV
jgi:hypothetical protein